MPSRYELGLSVLIAVALSLLAFPALGADNLLVNPDFETGEEPGENVPGWRASGYDGTNHIDAQFTISDQGRNGSWAGLLKLRPEHQWVLVDQHIPIKAKRSQALHFSVWMRAEQPISRVELVLYVNFPEQNFYDAGQVRTRFEVGTQWHKYETSLSQIRVIIQCYRPATELYVDDASLTLVAGDPKIAELLRDCVAPGTEAGLLPLGDNTVGLFFGIGGNIALRRSSDAGQTWSVPEFVRDTEGNKFGGWTPVLVRLPSGAIGMFLNEGERKLFFCRSEDNGRTWTVKRQINQEGQIARMYCGSAIVTSTGRIVGPTYTYLEDWYGRDNPNTPGPQTGMYCWLSDDEGQTWHTSEKIWLFHEGKRFWFEEGNVVELNDGRLLMFARTPVGRLFKSYSSDEGETWSDPEPTPLAAAYAPCALSRMPTGDLLCIWNQNTLEEDKQGLRRHRLTCAVSSDEGETWQHFRNLESLDDRAHIVDRPLDWDVFSYKHEQPYHQPTDLAKYPHAPGVLRCAYPSVVFVGDRAVIAYDYGAGLLTSHYTKIRSLPIKWFYGE